MSEAHSCQTFNPTPGYKIRRDVLEALDPLRKMAALSAIKRGYWLLVEEDDRHGTCPR